MIHIKRLLPPESLLWKNFRILALSKNPNAFFSGFSLEEERKFSDEQLQEQLKKNVILGVFDDEALIGTLGLRIFDGTKLSHRGILFDAYVHPKYRFTEILSQLLEAILDIAKKSVIQVHISILSTDKKSFEFYRRYGFSWMAAHPRSLKIGEQFCDEDILMLKFDD